jgi:ketosteroid isomerase-like protein
MSRSAEEDLIHRYFDAFNRQDLEGVMACFHEEPYMVNMKGKRIEGRDAVLRRYQEQFALFPDGRCELLTTAGRAGCGMAESRFTGTSADSGQRISALGAEILEFADGKIKAVRDYHRPPAVEES